MKKNTRLPAAMILSLLMALTLASPVAAASAPKVEEVDYDRYDKEVSIEFYGRVQWAEKPVVTITRNGRNYVRYISEKDRDEIEVKVRKLDDGKKYSYKVTGVKKKGTDGYKTVTGSFYAYDD